MCASLLRQYGIRKVYFGASNERFGGTGGVLRVHEREAGVGEGFEVSGGWLREEAILLLRRFYVQENVKGVWLLGFLYL
jgi:tRNA-specific adenosine deaminase 2